MGNRSFTYPKMLSLSIKFGLNHFGVEFLHAFLFDLYLTDFALYFHFAYNLCCCLRVFCIFAVLILMKIRKLAMQSEPWDEWQYYRLTLVEIHPQPHQRLQIAHGHL